MDHRHRATHTHITAQPRQLVYKKKKIYSYVTIHCSRVQSETVFDFNFKKSIILGSKKSLYMY